MGPLEGAGTGCWDWAGGFAACPLAGARATGGTSACSGIPFNIMEIYVVNDTNRKIGSQPQFIFVGGKRSYMHHSKQLVVLTPLCMCECLPHIVTVFHFVRTINL